MVQRALIIDDDPHFLAVIEPMLARLGVAGVSCAQTGAEGLARIKAAPDGYDLVLCDLQMPNMDGVNVVRRLGELGFSGALGIVSSEPGEVIASVQRVAEMIGIRVVGGLAKPLREAAVRDLLSAVPQSRPARRIPPVSKSELLEVLGVGRLVPVYQPQLDLGARKVTGTEALLRLRADDGQLVSAAGHLAAAERYGFITQMTIEIFERVVQDLADWHRAGLTLGTSVNISPASLKERELPDALSSRVRGAGLKTSLITLEITENQLIGFDADTLEVLARLRIAGFGLSVDDFGTGATSIDQLRRFPFTGLKLDRAFVHDAANDAFALETLSTSVRLAGLLNLHTVAEGVETELDLKTVQQAGIHMAQGYLISRPQTADQVSAWMGAAPRRPASHKVA